MRYIFSILIATVVNVVAYSGEIAERVDSAYLAGNYKDAVAGYRQLLTENGPSADIWYNLGNAYYRTGQMPQAIICYERSLRLDPTNADARANLEFVNSKTIDRPGDYGSFFSQALDSFSNLCTSNGWAIIGVILFALFVGGLFAYYFGDRVVIRKVGFFGGLVVFPLSIIAMWLSYQNYSHAKSDDEAIITSQSVILSTVPREPHDRNEEAMLLHQGTKLYISDSITIATDSLKTTWYNVKVDNNHEAWISSKDIEKI